MIGDTMVRQGAWFFRWRSYVLLGFIPLGILAISRPEAVETHFGPLADNIYELGCFVVALLGLGVRAFTVGFVPAKTSGRNTTRQVARTLNTTGMYSLTRNPLYFGNAIIYMAVALFTQDLYFTIVMLFFLVIYLERIIATEERFLEEKFGPSYVAWAKSVPVFFPRLSGWSKPDLKFSIRNVLRREYTGLFGIIAVMFVMETARDLLVEHKSSLEPVWIGIFAFGAVMYVTLLWMKKRTTLLSVPGR